MLFQADCDLYQSHSIHFPFIVSVSDLSKSMNSKQYMLELWMNRPGVVPHLMCICIQFNSITFVLFLIYVTCYWTIAVSAREKKWLINRSLSLTVTVFSGILFFFSSYNEKKVDAHSARGIQMLHKINDFVHFWKNGATVYIEIARHLNIIRIDFIDQPDCCRLNIPCVRLERKKWRFLSTSTLLRMKLINSISFRFVSSICVYVNGEEKFQRFIGKF